MAKKPWEVFVLEVKSICKLCRGHRCYWCGLSGNHNYRKNKGYTLRKRIIGRMVDELSNSIATEKIGNATYP